MNAATRMKEARTAAGFSLKDIAEQTRVPQRHLASLEEGDYGALPGMTYCAGFARAYARAVGLDEVALVAQLRADIDEQGGLGQTQHEFDEPVDPARIPPRWIAWVAAALALLLAAGYGLWRMQMTTPPTDEQIEAQVAREAPLPSQPQNPLPAAPAGPVVLTAADDVWLRIYQSDGTRLYEGTLARGESYTVPMGSRDPMILTGRPDALAITVGGQSVPPLGTAERTIADVPVSAVALLARESQPSPEEVANASTAPSTGQVAPAVPTAAGLPTVRRTTTQRRIPSPPAASPEVSAAENVATP